MLIADWEIPDMLTKTMQYWVSYFWHVHDEAVAALNRADHWLGPSGWFSVIVGGALLFIPLRYLIYYRSSIRKRMKDIERRLARGLIYRDAKSPRQKLVRALELHPPFVEESQSKGWKLMSLGEYLSTLRINQLEEDGNDSSSIPKLLERELEATIGSVLLRNLGPRLGAALLPMLGISQVDSWIAKLAAAIASYVASHIFVEVSEEWDPTEDRAAFPFAVSEIVAFVNLNQKIRMNKKPVDASVKVDVTPLKWMKRGETGYTPTYAGVADDLGDTAEDCSKGPDDLCHEEPAELIPNPFVVERDFEAAIAGLEERIREQASVTATSPSPDAELSTTSTAYNPDDRSLPEPIPVNERILPGLHIGWGDAKCTHTKREILRNRLLAVLMTRLCYNYSLVDQKQRKDVSADLFTIDYGGTKCHYPDEFVQTLMDKGHKIEVCPRSTITTFGIAACVKENDGSWTNIPIAFFFRTGYERQDGRPAYFSAPHGGLDMSITSGPLLGTQATRCDIQFYVAIEGLCGWHSNHNVDVPWVQAASTTEPYNTDQILHAVRMAGLLAVTFNSLATEMSLPFGGYGVLGVCNDSAAFIDFAMRGETNMYPLISTGRFLFHTGRRLLELEDTFSKQPGLEAAAVDLRRLVTASCNLESDIHNSPAQLIGATRRYLANNPLSFFQLTEDSKNMMSAIARIYEEYTNFEAASGVQTGQNSHLSNFVNFLFQKNPSLE